MPVEIAKLPLQWSSKRPKPSLDDGTILVYPTVRVEWVTMVNIHDQTFEAEIELSLCWRDETLAASLSGDPAWVDQDPFAQRLRLDELQPWHPNVCLTNVAEMKEVETWFRLHCESSLVVFRARLRALFREKFELQWFPFDRQWLTMRMVSFFEDVRFCQHWPEQWQAPLQGVPEDFINMECFILEEWHCSDAVCMHTRPTLARNSSSRLQYQELNVKLSLERRPWYYLLNVAFIDGALVSISLSVLLVPPEDFADRSAMSLTLLLTAVAFKQVVASHLPSISYFTLLDKYVMCGFVMQCLVVLQNAIAASYTLAEGAFSGWHWFDIWGGSMLLLYLVVYQSIFMYLATTRMRSKTHTASVDRFEAEAPKPPRLHLWHRVHRGDKIGRAHV